MYVHVRVNEQSLHFSGEPNDNEWVQFDLGEERAVVGVVTKGRVDFTQWVTSYNVQYTTHDNATDFTMFTNVVGDVEVREETLEIIEILCH